MEDQLGRLEEKILQAIDTISELRGRNDELRGRCETLEGEVSALTEQRDTLQRQLNEAREAAEVAEDGEARRQKAEEKVAGLLRKLEALG
jgi:FtsZ-binding cell division protein ZapB